MGLYNEIRKKKIEIENYIFPLLSDAMCSPDCAYIILAIVTYAVFKSPPKDLLGLSQVVVQSYFQGVGLCILGYASNLGTQSLLRKIEEMWTWLQEIKEYERIEREEERIENEEEKRDREYVKEMSQKLGNKLNIMDSKIDLLLGDKNENS